MLGRMREKDKKDKNIVGIKREQEREVETYKG